MSHQRDAVDSSKGKKRKRGDNETEPPTKGSRKRATRTRKGQEEGVAVNADQLAWKKISLQNDEFEDFEEIEGVDVDYVDKDGSKVIQFKVAAPLSKS